MKKVTINFDLDGTIANLYGVDNWLEKLIAEDPTPYVEAKPLLNLRLLAYQLNRLQEKGYQLAIISWLSKSASDDYHEMVTQAKIQWLNKHLPSVKWNRISILPYGTPKEKYCNWEKDILFDDEEYNRQQWFGKAYDVFGILEILKKMGES